MGKGIFDDYSDLFSDPAVRREYEEDRLFEQSVANIGGLLESLNIERRELARRLGVSKGRVTQLLSGERNLTLRTLASMAWALGYEFETKLRPMANRIGTPAVDDPGAPEWVLDMLGEGAGLEQAFVSRIASGAWIDHRAYTARSQRSLTHHDDLDHHDDVEFEVRRDSPAEPAFAA